MGRFARPPWSPNQILRPRCILWIVVDSKYLRHTCRTLVNLGEVGRPREMSVCQPDLIAHIPTRLVFGCIGVRSVPISPRWKGAQRIGEIVNYIGMRILLPTAQIGVLEQIAGAALLVD